MTASPTTLRRLYEALLHGFSPAEREQLETLIADHISTSRRTAAAAATDSHSGPLAPAGNTPTEGTVAPKNTAAT